MRGKSSYAAIALVAVAAVIQFIQPDRTNPPHDAAASLEAAAPVDVTAVVGRACKDCHSHRTAWPWYSRVAPASWLVAKDVKEGRSRLNLSEWNRFGPEMCVLRAKAMCAEVRKGEMPPLQYRLIHSEARLSDADVNALCAWQGAPRP